MSRDEQGTELVFGLGTGRCGTHSLTRLLDEAGPGPFTHEMSPHLPWACDSTLLRTQLERIEITPARPCGDVAFYLLPYVEEILDLRPQTRFIALRRDRQQTIESYLSKTDGRNHWMIHDGSEWDLDPVWDPCYPKYDVEGLDEAIGRYWDEYYSRVAQLEVDHPDNVRLWETDALNQPDAVRDMLSFAGLDTDRGEELAGVRTNRRRPPIADRLRAGGRRLRRHLPTRQR